MATTIPALGALAEEIRGEVITAADPRYEQARLVHNRAVDRRPAAIVRPRGAMDVVAVVRHARETGSELAVRGGAHHVAGFGASEGGIVLDLSTMRGAWVDHDRLTVRVQGGALWGDVDTETQAYSFATPGGTISDVGVGGFTLGGGMGWLSRRHGLAADNLVAADVVTADGRLVTASEETNPDLFWALRGGGGNFGVVTSFELRLYPVARIAAGLVIHPLAAAPAVLRRARDLMAEAPDRLALTAALTAVEGQRVLALAAAWFGDHAEGERVAAPLREAAAADSFAPTTYLAWQRALDPKDALQLHVGECSEYLADLPDDAIDALVDYLRGAPSRAARVFLIARGGAIARVPEDATAVSDRTSPWLAGARSAWDDSVAAGPNRVWIEHLARVVDGCRTGGTYVNMLADPARAADAYSAATRARLRSVKAAWDPDSLFRVGHAVPAP